MKRHKGKNNSVVLSLFFFEKRWRFVSILPALESEIKYLNSVDEYRIGESGLIVNDLERLHRNISSCGKTRITRRNISTGKGKIVEFHTCGKTKLCPRCADADYMKRIKALDSWFQENPELSKYGYFITFTQKKNSEESARSAARRILDSFRNFQRIGQKDRGKEYSKIASGVRSVEIEPTEDGYHAHIHAVVFSTEKLDYAVYDQKIRNAIRRELGWISKEKFVAEIEKRGGYIHGTPDSKISLEWQQCGIDCKSVEVEPLFSPIDRPVTIYRSISGGTEQQKKVSKKIRYSLKYSVKDGAFDVLKNGGLFDLIDGMSGLRKVQYLGGAGKYESSESVIDEDEFNYNYHSYEHKKKGLYTADDRIEKITREELREKRVAMKKKIGEYVARLKYMRKQMLLFFRAGSCDSVYYVNHVKGMYKRLGNRVKTMRKRLETEAEFYRRLLGVDETYWVSAIS